MVRKTIDDKWIREIHKEGVTGLTFCGALEERYKHIALYWNQATKEKHDREYNNIILQALENHNDKTLSEYTKEDFKRAIEIIKEKGYEQNGVRKQYSESSIHNFEYLIYAVVFQSSVVGICENVLWDTRFAINNLEESIEAIEVESRVRIKKSLSVLQEKNFFHAVTKGIDEDGAIVALLLMLGLGLRNGEACGLNYGDIKSIDGYEGCYVAWIYKSTRIESNELQSGGKTINTGRIVPVPQKIIEFLEERKKLICKIIEKQKVNADIDELPICCDGWVDEDTDSYARRCDAKNVTLIAKDIFSEAGISPKVLAFLDAELSEDNTATLLKEKDPTAYLLRRNFATQMCLLGLTISERQYLMGHDVEDAFESRNEFVDNERIYVMYKKLSQRALLNEVSYTPNRMKVGIHNNETTKIHILAKEPGDCVIANLNTENNITKVKTRLYEESEEKEFERTVNILDIIQQNYQKLQ